MATEDIELSLDTKVYQAARRAIGAKAITAILAKDGSTPGNLTPACVRALERATANAARDEAADDDRPKSKAILNPTAIYAKWNSSKSAD